MNKFTKMYLKPVAVLLCCVCLFLCTSCGAKKLEMNTTAVALEKVTNTGVVEYHGDYFITDEFGINCRSGINDTNRVVRINNSKENGVAQNNFAVDEKYIYFISHYDKDKSNILYRASIDGKKRSKIYVRDKINIVACYADKIYFTDERNMLIFIDAQTKEKTEVAEAVGKNFVQCNNSIFFTAGDDSLMVYNCDDKTVLSVDEGNTAGYSVTSNGLVYAVNSSKSDSGFDYTFYSFTYQGAEVEKKASLSSASKYTAFTNTLALANEKNSLKVCNINSGEEKEYSYKKPGKLIYNTGLDYNVYYLNDNVCLKFSPDSEQVQELKVDFKKNKIDYTQVIAIVDGEKAITMENNLYKVKSLA